MKTLQEILNSQTLKFYIDKVSKLKVLNEIWSTAVIDWAAHGKIANFEKGLLVIQVENAAWATRIKYAIPEISAKLVPYPAFKDLKKIICRVKTNS